MPLFAQELNFEESQLFTDLPVVMQAFCHSPESIFLGTQVCVLLQPSQLKTLQI